ncbi:MAG: FAD-containing oxidoreductase [Ilumatobacter sp.]|nr:FAD-containing oxidoreductase [Ilumatobacter sp.]
MSDEQFDAVIIGTGQAGPPLAGAMNEQGWRVAIVERHLLGGSCVNVGCTPTKAMVASAKAIHQARRGDEFGFDIGGELAVDMQRVHDRIHTIAGNSNEGVGKWIDGMEHVELIRGHARLDGPNRVVVDDRVLETERVFLNVGARARVPGIDGLDEVEFLTNSTLLELTEVPEHLVIVGGSYIGLEFAQIFRRLGAEVTVIEAGPHLISRDDPDVSEAVLEVMRGEGVGVRLDAECVSVAAGEDGGVRVVVECDDGAPEVDGSHLLLAVGRVPNTDDLGLDTTDVEVDDRGYVVVDDQLRTTVDGIWALGDCNGEGAFTHTSYNDHEIVASHLFGDGDRALSDRIVCYALYTDPPLGRVGMTERQARESSRSVLVGKRKMSRVSRAVEMSETHGFMKFLVDADTEELLGGAIFGLHGDEVIHLIADVMYAGAPYTTISRAVHIHPTVSELVPTTLQSLEPLEPLD